MNTSSVEKALETALTDRKLLNHKFYKRWNAGELSRAELTEYAEQYRHFEAALPEALCGVVTQLQDGPAKESVEANLRDEVGPPSHLELFDDFLLALDGNTETQASPAMANLVSAYEATVAAGPSAGLAGIAAYEVQSSDIAITKGDGLCNNYGLTKAQTEFWTLHGELEKDHAQWSIEGIAMACEESEQAVIVDAAKRVADAWWSFLDERQERSAELAA